ncbi:hypothetical protein ACVW00_004380 [Marmoricola sp. URHA0025 HA25]
MTTSITGSSGEPETAAKQHLYDIWQHPRYGEYPPREVVDTVFAHGFAADLSLGIGQVHFDEVSKQTTWTCIAVTDRVLLQVSATAVGPGGDIWSSSRPGRSAVEYLEYPNVTVVTTPLANLAGVEVTATGDVKAWQPEHAVRRTWKFRFIDGTDFELSTNEVDRLEHPNVSEVATFLASSI